MGAAGVSETFYYESKLKINKNFFLGGGGGGGAGTGRGRGWGARGGAGRGQWRGWGDGGARVSKKIFYKESKYKKKIFSFLGGVGGKSK